MPYETKTIHNVRLDTRLESGPPEEALAALEAFGGNGEKIFTFEGERSGPSLFVIGGMHGNELTGIIVVHELLKALQSGALKLAAGKITLALGNPKAIAENRRVRNGGPDMNRLFTRDALLKEEATWEERRARDLARVIAASDITIDIHSTNKPSIPFVISKTDEKHERVYRWFERGAILEDPDSIFWGEVATTEEYATQEGRVGIGIETGHVAETNKVPSILRSIHAILVDNAVVQGEQGEVPPDAPIYTLSERIIFQEGFRFANESAMRNFTEVRAGEIFAYRGNTPIAAPYDCVVLFPKILALREIGKPVCYLSKIKREVYGTYR